jgi:hypothetical protein
MAKIIMEVIFVFNSIREKRIQREGLYELTLQIPENDYFDVYDTVKVEAAREILYNYLTLQQDDARLGGVDISHNRNGHIVKITADLHYTGNDHTDGWNTPDYLNITRDNH